MMLDLPFALSISDDESGFSSCKSPNNNNSLSPACASVSRRERRRRAAQRHSGSLVLSRIDPLKLIWQRFRRRGSRTQTQRQTAAQQNRRAGTGGCIGERSSIKCCHDRGATTRRVGSVSHSIRAAHPTNPAASLIPASWERGARQWLARRRVWQRIESDETLTELVQQAKARWTAATVVL